MNSFLKKIIICFVKVETDPRLRYYHAVVKLLFHYELECLIRAMFFSRCMVKAKARGWALLA